ncbi:Rho-type gtpase-activating protein [Malassezia nana]|uniref:Rho-type gtpase-activating protein n=1 Tax=Malassezia nana TaxID=180528 RepID=A0AAF0EK59_9BASI|nr:Rho-type gtpase-activating protein [Malassezia nana]
MSINSDVFSRVHGALHCQDCLQASASFLPPYARSATAPSSPTQSLTGAPEREFESFDSHEKLASPLLDSNESSHARHKRSHTVTGAVPDALRAPEKEVSDPPPEQDTQDAMEERSSPSAALMDAPELTSEDAAQSAEGSSVVSSIPTQEQTHTDADAARYAESHQRLSDVIHAEILQAYSSMTPSSETPMQKKNRSASSTLQDLWNRPGSVSESEILKNLSLYDSEFEALIATPDFARHHERGWSLRSGSVLSTSLPGNSDEVSPVLDSDSVQTGQAPDWSSAGREAAKAQILDEITQLEIQRHVALAELLGVQSINEHMPAHNTSVHARVDKALESLRIHLDTVKAEYRKELESLSMMQQSVRQELKPMLQVRSTLMHESQKLAQHVDELTAQVAKLETRVHNAAASSQQLDSGYEQPMSSSPPPPPSFVSATASGPVSQVSSKTSSTSPLSTQDPFSLSDKAVPALVPPVMPPQTVSSPALSLQPADISSLSLSQTSPIPSASRLEQSLPPLPPPRKFRWIKPKLLTPELAALGETLLLPAHELARPKPVSTFSPPVPPKDAASVMRTQEPGSSPLCSFRRFPISAAPGQRHQRMPSIPNCVPSPLGTSMIGRPLREQVQLEGGTLVPRLVDWCILAVETNGLQDEGLYRKSGSTYGQRQLVQLFDSGKAFDLCDANVFNDMAIITSVLKSYLRKLPEPLIPSDMHVQFMELGERLAQSPTAVASMQALLEGLSPVHLATLERVCLHLKVVHQHQLQTRMNARNLGLVFGPTLMRAPEPALELLETPRYARIVECTLAF